MYGYWSARRRPGPSAGRLESLDGGAGLAPDRARRALEVRDLQPCAVARGADRVDRLVERREQVVALVAHVGRVQAAVPGRRRDERLHLVRRRVHPGRIDQPAGEADRPGVHRRLDLADHRREFRVGGHARVGAQDGGPDGVVADEERQVGTESLLLDAFEVLPERAPAGHELVRPESERDVFAADVGDRRERVAAVARTAGSCSPGGGGSPAPRRRGPSRRSGRADRRSPGRRRDRARPATISTSASLTDDRSPTARIRSPSRPMSAGLAVAPVPSTSRPPRRTRSKAVNATR